MHSYALSGFGFTADALEFLLTGVVSDEPWVGKSALMTLDPGRDFSGGPAISATTTSSASITRAGYDTEFAFANVLPAPVNVLPAPVPASLPLLLSGPTLLWIRRRSAPA